MGERRGEYRVLVGKLEERRQLGRARRRWKVLLKLIYKCDGDVDQWRTQEFCSGRGGSTNSVKDRGQRERGSGGGSPLVRGSGGSCNLVREISFHIVKCS